MTVNESIFTTKIIFISTTTHRTYTATDTHGANVYYIVCCDKSLLILLKAIIAFLKLFSICVSFYWYFVFVVVKFQCNVSTRKWHRCWQVYTEECIYMENCWLSDDYLCHLEFKKWICVTLIKWRKFLLVIFVYVKDDGIHQMLCLEFLYFGIEHLQEIVIYLSKPM